MYQIYIFFTFYPCKEFPEIVFLNSKFCYKTLDGAVRSSNSIWLNDIIELAAQRSDTWLGRVAVAERFKTLKQCNMAAYMQINYLPARYPR